jgi:hypothetical protein
MQLLCYGDLTRTGLISTFDGKKTPCGATCICPAPCHRVRSRVLPAFDQSITPTVAEEPRRRRRIPPAALVPRRAPS